MDHTQHGGEDEYLRRLAGRLPSMLAYWDRGLLCRYANAACASGFGVAPGSMLGRSMPDLLGPYRFALEEPFVRDALEGRARTFERIVPGVDGVARRSLAHYEPDLVDGAVAGLCMQITEDSLPESDQALAVALASAATGFIGTDAEGRVLRMNTLAEELTGWRLAEARGQQLQTVFAHEASGTALPAMSPAQALDEAHAGVDRDHHVSAIARDGTRRPMAVKTALARDAGGGVRGMAMVFRDMTRQLAAEIDANLLAAIVESSNDAVIGKTLDGRITSWNAAAEALFGYRADEIVGRPVQLLIPPERTDEEMAILTRLARGEKVPVLETVRLAKDGSPREVSLAISPIRDAHGRIVGASKIVRDVSPQRRAEQSRQRALQLEAENRQVLEASRLKSLFLANMSHELRTPLNAIIGFADLLRSGTAPAEAERQQRFAGHIASSGRHLLQMINDVLDLSKAEAGRLAFFPEPVDLARLAHEIAEVMRSALDRKRLVLRIEIDPALQDIVIDPARLKQVLYNYLSNAVKFSPEGAVVTLRARPEDETRFRIEVEDAGAGIDEAQLPRLFRDFQQLDDGYTKQHAGTGLGLALTRRLVQAQGGTVGVRSRPGTGSVFHAVLDRRPPAKAPAQRRCLVVEDDPALQAQLRDSIGRIGFHVDTAADAPQAIEHAQRTAYDALTLDLRLPGRPGLDLLAGLRSSSTHRRAPVVGMTMPAQTGHTAAFAIADVIGKPAAGDEVAAALALLPRERGRRLRVMVVDDDPLALDLMNVTLAALDVDAVCVGDGLDALAELALHPCDAIILDLLLPGMDGFAVLDALQDLPARRDTPVFIWTCMLLSEADYAQLERSAHAILGKGGGAFAAMLENLCRRLPALPMATAAPAAPASPDSRWPPAPT